MPLLSAIIALVSSCIIAILMVYSKKKLITVSNDKGRINKIEAIATT